MRQAGHRQRCGDETELLPEIEPVHREMIAQHVARHVHDHRVPPVGLRDVEPEVLQPFRQAARRLRHQPEGAKVAEIQQGTGRRAQHGQTDYARREQRAPPGRRGDEQERGVGGSEQNHRQMIAKSQCVAGKERREPPDRGRGRPAEQQQQRQRDEERVQRVDFGDDRLAPERVRSGVEPCRRGPRERRPGQLDAGDRQQTTGNRALDCGREVQGVGRLGPGQPHQGLRDGEVQRIAFPRRDDRRTDGRLKRSGVAEIDAGEEGGPIERERRAANDHSR